MTISNVLYLPSVCPLPVLSHSAEAGRNRGWWSICLRGLHKCMSYLLAVERWQTCSVNPKVHEFFWLAGKQELCTHGWDLAACTGFENLFCAQSLWNYSPLGSHMLFKAQCATIWTVLTKLTSRWVWRYEQHAFSHPKALPFCSYSVCRWILLWGWQFWNMTSWARYIGLSKNVSRNTVNSHVTLGE